MRSRVAFLFCLGLLLSLAATSQASGQQQPPEKKKARKVWTNDDFPARPAPAAKKEEAQKPGESRSLAELFAELDNAREERKLTQETLEAFQKGLEELRERRFNARDDYDRDFLDLAIEAREADIAKVEAQLKELDARIAELEKLTKGRKRPQPPKQEAKTPPSPP